MIEEDRCARHRGTARKRSALPRGPPRGGAPRYSSTAARTTPAAMRPTSSTTRGAGTTTSSSDRPDAPVPHVANATGSRSTTWLPGRPDLHVRRLLHGHAVSAVMHAHRAAGQRGRWWKAARFLLPVHNEGARGHARHEQWRKRLSFVARQGTRRRRVLPAPREQTVIMGPASIYSGYRDCK